MNPDGPLSDLMEFVDRQKREAVEDAQRYLQMNANICQMCLTEGEDRRNLIISCFYAIKEVVPEALDLSQSVLPELKERGYFLRCCKSCRSRFLSHLKIWRDECISIRDSEMDEDGNLIPSDPERNIPVRILGAIQWLTRDEWDARTKAKG